MQRVLCPSKVFQKIKTDDVRPLSTIHLAPFFLSVSLSFLFYLVVSFHFFSCPFLSLLCFFCTFPFFFFFLFFFFFCPSLFPSFSVVMWGVFFSVRRRHLLSGGLVKCPCNLQHDALHDREEEERGGSTVPRRIM